MTSKLLDLSDFCVNQNRVYQTQKKKISTLFANCFTSGILSLCIFKSDVNVFAIISDDIEATEMNIANCFTYMHVNTGMIFK